MKTTGTLFLAFLTVMLGSCDTGLEEGSVQEQLSIERISQMSDFPAPYNMLDWKEIALNFDREIFNFDAGGTYWPMIWLDDSRKNLDQTTFGLYTAIGDVRQGPDKNGGMFHESLNSLGAILGASLVGIDKSNQDGHNYVKMVQNYFNTDIGWNIIMNNTCPEVALLGGGYARDWWYDVFPNVLFYGMASFYPEVEMTDKILLSIADQFYKADSVLQGSYDYSFFDYGNMEGKKNFITSQEDAAAGHAYVLYCAYQKFGDKRYLEGAISAMEALEKLEENRFYEVLMPFGAYVAARLNAEQGTDFDPSLWINWSFDGAVGREGWGVLQGIWNGYEVSGLVGSISHNDGYGFLMNTFDMAWPLVAMVRYDARYANAIGKWMLHAANASHYMYPDEMAVEHQTLPQHAPLTKGVIAYEGIIHHTDYEEFKDMEAPVVQGDGPNWVKDENPDVSQFSIYGSSHVGIFGAIIEESDVEGILRLDLLATDFYREKAYPTYLYYNPYGVEKNISVEEIPGEYYDIISKRSSDHSGGTLSIPAHSSIVLVILPENGEKKVVDGTLLCNDIVVDFNYCSVK